MGNDISYNLPEGIEKYRGQFIVFFSDDHKPEVLFNSVVAEEANQKAKDIASATGKMPVVIRIQTEEKPNIIQRLVLRSHV